jgi:cation transport regulator ChaB
MRYGTTSELPDAVRTALPEPAQEVYREVFNRALDEQEDTREPEEARITAAHDLAWKVVTRLSKQDPRDRWSPKAFDGIVPGLGADGERSSPIPDLRMGEPRKTSGMRKTTSSGSDR